MLLLVSITTVASFSLLSNWCITTLAAETTAAATATAAAVGAAPDYSVEPSTDTAIFTAAGLNLRFSIVVVVIINDEAG